ncbi:MAG: M10 family metallopeptidase C-terminal domain-containing protein [Paracoccaceae bacterium]
MTISNPALLDILAQISDLAYEQTTSPTSLGEYQELQLEINNELVVPTIDHPTGFQGRAFFNETTNELVIAFTGTEGLTPDNMSAEEFLPDVITDLALTVTGNSLQGAAAVAFIQQAYNAALLRAPFGNFEIVYTGHSLGGFHAQTASAVAAAINPALEGEVVVFNSPGAGGFLGLPNENSFPPENYTYIYSNPDDWGAIGGPVHSIGRPLSDNIYIVPGAEGHGLVTNDETGLSNVLDGSIVPQLADDSIFWPVNEVIQGIAAYGLGEAINALMDLYDDGTVTPDGIVSGSDASDLIDASYVDADGDQTGAGDDYVTGGAGDDTLRPTGGDDTVIGGDGDDVIYAHTGQDVIEGNAGNDTLQGGEGDDTLTGGAGADWIDGGDGLDYASYADASAGVRLDLLGLVATLGDAAGDTVQNIEGVIGSDHDDTLYGDNAANHLIGGLGDDRLYGRGGGDTVDGGAGNDRLFGNGVQDIMIGGAGADVFGFNNEADSRNGIDNRDTIVDFETGVDVIDLGNVDADISTAEDDSFTFLGLTGSFTGNAGELRYARSVANDLTLIQIDTDGDALADMQIELTGLHDLTAGDFIL